MKIVRLAKRAGQRVAQFGFSVGVAGLFICPVIAVAQLKIPPPAETRVAPATLAAPLITAPGANDLASAPKESVRVLLIPDGETTLSSPVTAKIKSLNASIGAYFGAGQALVNFDCEEPVARLNMANAELAGAIESHEAKVRMQGLEQASDVEVALAASAAAKARGQVELQKAQVAQCTVVAPWAGRVAKIHVRTYMSVTPGQAMVDLVKSGPLRLKLNVSSRLIGKIKAGTPIEVSIDETGKTYQARIQAVNSRVDPVSQTIEVEAAISKYYADLLPGMSGTANLLPLRP